MEEGGLDNVVKGSSGDSLNAIMKTQSEHFYDIIGIDTDINGGLYTCGAKLCIPKSL